MSTLEFTFDLFENLDHVQEVTNPTSVKGISNTFTEDGVYSEKIFGPLKNFKCTCGKLFSKSNRGKRCVECGTLCDKSNLRNKTFGKIVLPDKIWVITPPLMKKAEQIFGNQAVKSLCEPNHYEKNSQKPFYFSLEKFTLLKKEQFKTNERVADFAVHDITTLRGLYLKLIKHPIYGQMILDRFADPRLAYHLFTNTILVIPPNSRPVAKLNDKFQVHEISAKYIELLKNIKNSFTDSIFQANTSGFGATVYKYQKGINELYASLDKKGYIGKEALVRESLVGKTVENSARNTIVPDPSLDPDKISLHQDVVEAIFCLEISHWYNKQLESTTLINYIQKIHVYTDQGGVLRLPSELFVKFINEVGPTLLMIIERQPVLFKLNTSGAKLGRVILRNEDEWSYPQDRVMGVNPMSAPRFNFDFDGDTMPVFTVSTKQGKAMFYKMWMNNQVEYEHHTGLITTPEHEAIYAAYMLSLFGNIDLNNINEDDIVEIDDETELNDIEVSIIDLLENYDIPVRFREEIYSYNTIFINIALNQNKIIYTPQKMGLLKKSNLKKLMIQLREEVGDATYHYALHNFDKVLLEVGTLVQYCQPTYDLSDFAIGNDEIDEYKNTLVNEPYIGFHQNDILFNDYVKPEVLKNPENILGRVFESEARIKSVQLLKAASNNGIPTNIYGKAFNLNIKNSLLDGLDKREFYIAGDSARLALDQRQTAIPKGGELQRKFYYNTGFLYLNRDIDDCGTTVGFKVTIESKSHLKSLYSRYLMNGEKININDDTLIGTEIELRSPVTCKAKHYNVCKKCFGDKQPTSDALGASIGSYIAESIIQTVLRAHHFSGAFITEIKKDMLGMIKGLTFSSPNIVSGDEEKVRALEQFMWDNYYDKGDITFDKVEGCNDYLINVHNLPFNDDSVKLLGNIIGMIDKNRSIENRDLIYQGEMYSFLLDNIVIPNGILSIFIELIVSILYYDEDDVMTRYSDKEPIYQVALKNVTEKLDPGIAIFHNFSATAIDRCYSSLNKKDELKHMYEEMINIFH